MPNKIPRVSKNPETIKLATRYIAHTMGDINRASGYRDVVKGYWGVEREKAKDKSNFYKSGLGVASKLPSAIGDTLKKTVRFVKGNK